MVHSTGVYSDFLIETISTSLVAYLCFIKSYNFVSVCENQKESNLAPKQIGFVRRDPSVAARCLRAYVVNQQLIRYACASVIACKCALYAFQKIFLGLLETLERGHLSKPLNCYDCLEQEVK